MDGSVTLATMGTLKNNGFMLPPRILGLVTEWAELHKEELMENWNSLKKTREYEKIKKAIAAKEEQWLVLQDS